MVWIQQMDYFAKISSNWCSGHTYKNKPPVLTGTLLVLIFNAKIDSEEKSISID